MFGPSKKCAKQAKQNIAQGKQSEIAGGRIFHARLQPGSGCGKIHKEDLRGKNTIVQVKSSRKRSMTLKFEDLRNLIESSDRETTRSGAKVHAVMFIDILDFPMDVRRWVLIPLEDYTWLKRRK